MGLRETAETRQDTKNQESAYIFRILRHQGTRFTFLFDVTINDKGSDVSMVFYSLQMKAMKSFEFKQLLK